MESEKRFGIQYHDTKNNVKVIVGEQGELSVFDNVDDAEKFCKKTINYSVKFAGDKNYDLIIIDEKSNEIKRFHGNKNHEIFEVYCDGQSLKEINGIVLDNTSAFKAKEFIVQIKDFIYVNHPNLKKNAEFSIYKKTIDETFFYNL